jgi:hypothetical protein
MLFTIDLYEDFINEECGAVVPVLVLQSSSVCGCEFDASEAY